MTVWVVQAYDGDDSGVEAVFSTREKAEKFVAKWEAKATCTDAVLSITAHSLDERVDDTPVIVTAVLVLTVNGVVQRTWTETYWHSKLELYPSVNTAKANAHFCTGRSSDGEEAALRLAEAARQEWLKANPPRP